MRDDFSADVKRNLAFRVSTTCSNKLQIRQFTITVVPSFLKIIDNISDLRLKTTLGLYTQDDSSEMQAAQGAFLSAVGLGSRLVQ
jgi:hypothetical protein